MACRDPLLEFGRNVPVSKGQLEGPATTGQVTPAGMQREETRAGALTMFQCVQSEPGANDRVSGELAMDEPNCDCERSGEGGKAEDGHGGARQELC